MKTLFATALIFTFAGPAIAEDVPKDQQTLQGSWKVETVTEDGKEIEAAKGSTFTFEKSHFTGKGKRGEMKGTYTIKPEKSPKQMDFIVTRDGNTMTMPMIYKIEKVQLTICAARKPGGKRPTEFKSADGSGHVLIEMKRMKTEAE